MIFRFYDPDSFYESLNILKREYEILTEELKDADETIKKFNKDEELLKKELEIEKIKQNSLYIMTDKEVEKYNNFRNKHYKKCGNSNNYCFDLCGTGVGTVVHIMCPVCKETEDLTDFGAW